MIRRKRRYGARKRSVSAPAAITLSRKPSKRKQWSDEEMVAAIKAVESGMGVKRAAEQHGVPLTTLRDRISGRVIHGTKAGPKPYLNQEEEKELAPSTSKLTLSPPTAAPSTSKVTLSPPTATLSTSKVTLSPPTAAPSTSKVTLSPPTAAPFTSKVTLSPPTAAPSMSKVTTASSKLITPPATPSPTPLRKYLTISSQTTAKHQKALPRARLLTSTEVLAQLEKKEQKKVAAQEEKERKKAERMEKKRKKEDEQKRKQEERKKKAEEKAKKAGQKESKISRKSASRSSEARASVPPRKRARQQRETESEINTDMCCVCCVLYSEDVNGGSDWIECACGRWLHEDCAEDCVVGADGRERFCPSCL